MPFWVVARQRPYWPTVEVGVGWGRGAGAGVAWGRLGAVLLENS